MNFSESLIIQPSRAYTFYPIQGSNDNHENLWIRKGSINYEPGETRESVSHNTLQLTHKEGHRMF